MDQSNVDQIHFFHGRLRSDSDCIIKKQISHNNSPYKTNAHNSKDFT